MFGLNSDRVGGDFLPSRIRPNWAIAYYSLIDTSGYSMPLRLDSASVRGSSTILSMRKNVVVLLLHSGTACCLCLCVSFCAFVSEQKNGIFRPRLDFLSLHPLKVRCQIQIDRLAYFFSCPIIRDS